MESISRLGFQKLINLDIKHEKVHSNKYIRCLYT
ncbi:hypothetical protein Goshw_018016 [Gossypium schwendimanii]|uniref:Uncharacterized protein n=1 Tax=Gossypium schwendimanii TaxID=34291 RepID=A0A7J9LPI9_GOSSC|nr:hypothetical protein [Gossypium schwendimanii]